MDDIIKACFNSCIEINNKLKIYEISKNITNKINSSGDCVKEMDIVSNNIFHKNLKECNSVFKFISEEDSEETLVNCSGKYYVTLDPLDGSNNIDCNNIVGSIFCIFKIDKFKKINSGKDIIAAGYCIYGPSVQIVLSYRNSTKLFQLIDNNFKLILDNILLPKNGNFYCCNYYQKETYNDFYLKGLVNLEENNKKNRWSGCMVADIHRILLNGGVFIYPSSKKYINGKIRLLYEIFPMAFIIENTGGYSFNHTIKSALDIKINYNNLHNKHPIVLASEYEFKLFF